MERPVVIVVVIPVEGESRIAEVPVPGIVVGVVPAPVRGIVEPVGIVVVRIVHGEIDLRIRVVVIILIVPVAGYVVSVVGRRIIFIFFLGLVGIIDVFYGVKSRIGVIKVVLIVDHLLDIDLRALHGVRILYVPVSMAFVAEVSRIVYLAVDVEICVIGRNGHSIGVTDDILVEEVESKKRIHIDP